MPSAARKTNVLSWPSKLLDVSEVQRWISDTLPGQPKVIGPTKIDHVKTWGVIGRFSIQNSQNEYEVVFKASHLSLFTYGPLVDDLLWQHCPKYVPQTLAWEEWPDRAWSIFLPFTGQTVSSINDVEPMMMMARTLAEIQTTVASLPNPPFTNANYRWRRVESALGNFLQ